MTELALQVLLALGNGPAHGYAIGQDIAERSDGHFGPTTGSLYQTLKRLSDEGVIREVAPPGSESTDGRRRYFALTAAGRREAAAELARLRALVEVGRARRLDGVREG